MNYPGVFDTVRNADKIVVLKDRAIREMGTHEELLRLGGLYSRLYSVQRSLEPLPVMGAAPSRPPTAG